MITCIVAPDNDKTDPSPLCHLLPVFNNRIHSVTRAAQTKHLAAAERAKAGEYGFRLNEPADIHTGVRPFVLDPRGGLGKQATAVSGYSIRLRAAHLRLHNAVQPAEAQRLAEAGFWTPVSCLLLQARWHGSAWTGPRVEAGPACGVKFPAMTA